MLRSFGRGARDDISTAGKSLPVELIVRDRRFRKEEIRKMCEDVGVEVVWTRFVSAGDWDNALDYNNSREKGILFLCRKINSIKLEY